MGLKLIYGIFFLFIILGFGIVIFIYSKRNKSLFGYIISIFIFLFVLMFFLFNSIDESSITKFDVKNDMKQFDVELMDDFEIKTNVVRGFPKRIQETEIVITNKDKDRIISEIKNVSSLQPFNSSTLDYSEIEKIDRIYKILNSKPPYFQF